jgi:hypothetical protein
MIVSLETQTGRPIQAGRTTLTPVSQAFRVQLPRLPIGFIWNRPTAIQVDTADGQSQLLPVRDVTNQALIAIAGFTFLGLLLVAAARKR